MANSQDYLCFLLIHTTQSLRTVGHEDTLEWLRMDRSLSEDQRTMIMGFAERTLKRAAIKAEELRAMEE